MAEPERGACHRGHAFVTARPKGTWPVANGWQRVGMQSLANLVGHTTKERGRPVTGHRPGRQRVGQRAWPDVACLPLPAPGLGRNTSVTVLQVVDRFLLLAAAGTRGERHRVVVVAAPTTATLSCSPAQSRDDAAAVLFPLPPPTADEGMDLSVSRKRQREESSDDESSGPHKLFPPAPSLLDDSSLLDQLEERSPPPLTHLLQMGGPPATPWLHLLKPHHLLYHRACSQSPAYGCYRGGRVSGLEATTEHMDDGSAPPPPSVAFLKTPARPPAPRTPGGRKIGRQNGKLQLAPQGLLLLPLLPRRDLAHLLLSRYAQRWHPLLQSRLPEDEVAFQVVQSRAAQRRARLLDSAALPVNPSSRGLVPRPPPLDPGPGSLGAPWGRLTSGSTTSGTSWQQMRRRGSAWSNSLLSRCCRGSLWHPGSRLTAGRARASSTGWMGSQRMTACCQPFSRRTGAVCFQGGPYRRPTLRGPCPPGAGILVQGTLHGCGRPAPVHCSAGSAARFGHLKESCSWPNSCIRCGRPHPKDGECQRPRCVNCSGPHPANTPACPRWQQERRVATIMASSTTALSRRVVRAAVREETRTDRDLLRVAPSYASILQGVSKPATPSPRASHRPPPAVAPTSASASQPAAHGPAATAVASSARAPTPATTAVALPAAVPAPPGPAVSTENQEAVDHMVQAVLMAMQFACAQVPAAHPLHAIYQQARLARTSLTAIDVTLATPGVCYGWATASDSWGSDHLPILVTPAGGKVPRSRRYKVVDWRIYRQLLDDPTGLRDFFGAMTRAAEAATIVTTVPVNQPVPDIHHLNLRAARRRAERTYLRGGSRTAFNRLNAACRRHANQRWRQGWQGICNTVGKSKGGATAWRLLGSLISGPSLRQPVLTAAIAMNLREDALAEQLADQFSVVAAAPPTAVPDRGAPGLPQGHHPAWAARVAFRPGAFEAAVQKTYGDVGRSKEMFT
ncbi:hypothetical protein HPB52_007743 [Rhipicephalus sanguineus]|uniref:Endonuclease/exonuclease/phosphatase domain-containing protein n=1 Tax=Rhipicephalus sanguineus TaxID=34632 RepID=A0A9D4PLZ1_RHISA|nr:hypothetical protein HPB52_007743 [Rhipicephalus sanguineus]